MKFALCAILMPLIFASSHGGVQESLSAITKVQREGDGNETATAAWKELVDAGPSSLMPVIAATGRGGVIADNWLRLAGAAIVENALKKNRTIPVDELEQFVRDTNHAAPGRQLAFDLLKEADSEKANVVEKSLIQDPVQELRRGAVQWLIDSAKEKQGEGAKAVYLQALQAVRDEDQTKIVASALKKLGVTVDLPRHFGFLTKWSIIGPFENAGRTGFDTVFPPEKGIQLDATHAGKTGEVKWRPFESTDEYGKIDFNKPLGMQKEVTAYAVATFDSSEEREAELRLGSKNAWKVWLNGEFLFGRDEYHRGQQMDQYKLKCRLKKGSNTVLVKCCQNEQKEDWTVEWEFQLRICDSTGTAILSSVQPSNF